MFIEIMFDFLLHLLIKNFQPKSYCFERNNSILKNNRILTMKGV